MLQWERDDGRITADQDGCDSSGSGPAGRGALPDVAKMAAAFPAIAALRLEEDATFYAMVVSVGSPIVTRSNGGAPRRGPAEVAERGLGSPLLRARVLWCVCAQTT